MQEVVHALLDLRSCGRQVAVRQRAGEEGNLAHAQPGGCDQQVGQVQDLRRAVQPGVGLHRLAEDLLEPADVPGELRTVLLLDVEQEGLVASVADLRGVGVAVGDELLGLAAVQALITGLQVDVLVLIAAVGVVVVVARIDRRIDTAQLVDRLLEAPERGHDHVVDRQPRDLPDRLQQVREPTRVRGVQPSRTDNSARRLDGHP